MIITVYGLYADTYSFIDFLAKLLADVLKEGSAKGESTWFPMQTLVHNTD